MPRRVTRGQITAAILTALLSCVTAKAQTEQAKLTASDATPEWADGAVHFGNDVALCGERALVGAWAFRRLDGAAYVLEREGGNWSEVAKLTASDPLPPLAGGGFGRSVALDGERAFSIEPRTLYIFSGPPKPPKPQAQFFRGDTDSNGKIELTDGIVTLTFLFVDSTKMPACLDAADADDSGDLGLTDAVRIFGWLFTGGIPSEPPGPRPGLAAYEKQDYGEDPTAEVPDLGCGTLSMTCQ